MDLLTEGLGNLEGIHYPIQKLPLDPVAPGKGRLKKTAGLDGCGVLIGAQLGGLALIS